LFSRNVSFGETSSRSALPILVYAMKPERARTLKVEKFVFDPENFLPNMFPFNENAVGGDTFIARFNVRVKGKPIIKIIMHNRYWEKINVIKASEGI
jgi:hypothetical protein